eukprot:TRINITY_DN20644_c0_g1_i1.p1 TRINITY_DN20644_c0_g1~~TRINITY_DN20644_c0_g1_i1.p1  ORF type:complete len:1120 (-),score=327.55 TRINITY_DN20644_c0_g1_i1:73-3432(-)
MQGSKSYAQRAAAASAARGGVAAARSQSAAAGGRCSGSPPRAGSVSTSSPPKATPAAASNVSGGRRASGQQRRNSTVRARQSPSSPPGPTWSPEGGSPPKDVSTGMSIASPSFDRLAEAYLSTVPASPAEVRQRVSIEELAAQRDIATLRRRLEASLQADVAQLREGLGRCAEEARTACLEARKSASAACIEELRERLGSLEGSATEQAEFARSHHEAAMAALKSGDRAVADELLGKMRELNDKLGANMQALEEQLAEDLRIALGSAADRAAAEASKLEEDHQARRELRTELVEARESLARDIGDLRGDMLHLSEGSQATQASALLELKSEFQSSLQEALAQCQDLASASLADRQAAAAEAKVAQELGQQALAGASDAVADQKAAVAEAAEAARLAQASAQQCQACAAAVQAERLESVAVAAEAAEAAATLKEELAKARQAYASAAEAERLEARRTMQELAQECLACASAAKADRDLAAVEAKEATKIAEEAAAQAERESSARGAESAVAATCAEEPSSGEAAAEVVKSSQESCCAARAEVQQVRQLCEELLALVTEQQSQACGGCLALQQDVEGLAARIEDQEEVTMLPASSMERARFDASSICALTASPQTPKSGLAPFSQDLDAEGGSSSFRARHRPDISEEFARQWEVLGSQKLELESQRTLVDSCWNELCSLKTQLASRVTPVTPRAEQERMAVAEGAIAGQQALLNGLRSDVERLEQEMQACRESCGEGESMLLTTMKQALEEDLKERAASFGSAANNALETRLKEQDGALSKMQEEIQRLGQEQANLLAASTEVASGLEAFEERQQALKRHCRAWANEAVKSSQEMLLEKLKELSREVATSAAQSEVLTGQTQQQCRAWVDSALGRLEDLALRTRERLASFSVELQEMREAQKTDAVSEMLERLVSSRLADLQGEVAAVAKDCKAGLVSLDARLGEEVLRLGGDLEVLTDEHQRLVARGARGSRSSKAQKDCCYQPGSAPPCQSEVEKSLRRARPAAVAAAVIHEGAQPGEPTRGSAEGSAAGSTTMPFELGEPLVASISVAQSDANEEPEKAKAAASPQFQEALASSGGASPPCTPTALQAGGTLESPNKVQSDRLRSTNLLATSSSPPAG